VNDWPLAASRTEIEKVRPFCLQVSEEEKAAHHAGLVGVLFSPSVVCTKDRLSRLFLLHARHVDPSRCGEDPTTAIRWTRYYTPDSVGPSGQTMRAVREHVLREDANVLAD